jgi:hypothetical protein
MAMPATRSRVLTHPIADGDLRRAGEFLYVNLNSRVEPDEWVRALRVPWDVEQPNHGYMLLDGDTVVGVQLAFYSEREIRGSTENFCNLGAWCVLPGFRIHALRLPKAVLAQDDHHFTDLSPSGSVMSVNERLGFRFLDGATSLTPNLPWASPRGRARVSAEPTRIMSVLSGGELEIFLDHVAAPAARHLLLEHGDDHCHVIFRPDRKKGLPTFASLVYVSNPDVFHRMVGPFGNHLLLYHGLSATLADERLVGRPPRGSMPVHWSRRRMFRSDSLEPADIDYLYSELVCVPW